jgi:hypothetical protein
MKDPFFFFPFLLRRHFLHFIIVELKELPYYNTFPREKSEETEIKLVLCFLVVIRSAVIIRLFSFD